MKQQTEFNRGEKKGYHDALVMSAQCTDFPNKSESYKLGYEKGFKEGIKANKHAEKTDKKTFFTGYKEGRFLATYRTQSDIKR